VYARPVGLDSTKFERPMGLPTVAQLREHVETSLPDAALERILAAAEQAIATWAGPLEIDEDGVVADVAERLRAPGRTLLRLHQVPTAITSVTDVRDGIEALLGPSSYRLVDRYLRRLGGVTWGEWTTVVYAPTDDSAVRRTVLVQLCQLELNVQPGMAAQGAGPWSETYGAYLRPRNELLRAIRPADPPVPRAVPYTTADVG
jgi:hypothetical protein